MKTLRDLQTVLEMIKFEHTIFALPFAFSGMMLAAEGWPSWRTVAWIIVAMVGARSAAMAFNRWVDRWIDAANPRTADRALPSGRVSAAFVVAFIVASCALLVVAAWQLNPLALALSPVALLIVLGYSFTKRFTWASHLLLGLALSGAPLGAWIAVELAILRPGLVDKLVLTAAAGLRVKDAPMAELFIDDIEKLHHTISHLLLIGLDPELPNHATDLAAYRMTRIERIAGVLEHHLQLRNL